MISEFLTALASQPLMLTGGAVLGFVVGILTGLFGAGGGFIVTPALNIFLGLPMNIAVGTSACQVLGASAFSLYHHLDRNLYGIKVAACIGIGIPLGSTAGSRLVGKMVNLGNITVNSRELAAVNFILLIIFSLFLTLIAGWLLYDNVIRRRGKTEDDSSHVGLLASLRIPPMLNFRTIPAGPYSAVVLFFLGCLMGFLGGLLGIGGGVIMLPALFYLVGQETKFATRTDMMLVFLTGLFTTINHAKQGNVNYIIAAALIVGAFFGTKLGAHIQKRISGKSIRQYFGFVVLATAIMVAVRLWTMICA